MIAPHDLFLVYATGRYVRRCFLYFRMRAALHHHRIRSTSISRDWYTQQWMMFAICVAGSLLNVKKLAKHLNAILYGGLTNAWRSRFLSDLDQYRKSSGSQDFDFVSEQRHGGSVGMSMIRH